MGSVVRSATRAGLVVAVAALVGPVGAAAAAPAKPHSLAKSTVVSGNAVSVPPGEDRGAEVSCPADTKVVGGGETNAVLLPSSAELITSAPLVPGNGWRTSVKNSSPLLPVSFRTWAVCASGIDGYQIPYLQDQLIAPGSRAEFFRPCAGGLYTLGGGASSGKTVQLTDTYPSGNNYWTTGVFNTSLETRQYVTVYNICGTGIARPEARIGGWVYNVRPGAYADSSFSCPSGSTVLSGGASPYPRGSVVVTDTYPSSDGKSWNVKVKNKSDADINLATSLLCAK